MVAVYVAIALSGFCALAGEVIWTRLLGLLFGATVYTFSLILAVFLVGLGIGSSVGSVLSRTVTRPRLAFGWCQVCAVAAVGWASRTISQSLPYWPVSPSLCASVRFEFEFDFVRALWAAAACGRALGRQLPAGAWRPAAHRGARPRAAWSAACMRGEHDWRGGLARFWPRACCSIACDWFGGARSS